MSVFSFYFSKFKYLFCALFFICTPILNTLEVKAQLVVPPIVLLNFNQGNQSSPYYNYSLPESEFIQTSSLPTLLASYDIPSQDYKLFGTVYTNCPDANCDGTANLLLEVSTATLQLENALSSVTVKLSGIVGGQAIDFSQPTPINVVPDNTVSSLPYRSDIMLFGDVDESTVDILDKAGSYTGVLTVKITIQ